MSDQKDIGHYLEVPEDQREDVDPPAEYNADAGFDIEVVPDGEYVELGTAQEEPLNEREVDDSGDGAPEFFLTPSDPEHQKEDD